jgi:hypothetical protein
LKIVKRASWGARQPESVTLRGPWKGVVVHWFGSPRGAKKHAGCPALLRSVQRSHQAGEFNDIAYNFGVCPHGVVYELRGLAVQTGANGTTQTNREYGAIVVMIGKGDKFTDEAKVALGLAIAHVRNEPDVGRQVRRHGEITGSECPGPDIGRWVKEKRYDKAPPIVNTPLEEAIALIEASAAFKNKHRRILLAWKKLTALRKKK